MRLSREEVFVAVADFLEEAPDVPALRELLHKIYLEPTVRLGRELLAKRQREKNSGADVPPMPVPDVPEPADDVDDRISLPRARESPQARSLHAQR